MCLECRKGTETNNSYNQTFGCGEKHFVSGPFTSHTGNTISKGMLKESGLFKMKTEKRKKEENISCVCEGWDKLHSKDVSDWTFRKFLNRRTVVNYLGRL